MSDTPSPDDLLDRLREWSTSDSGHIADKRGFCQVCSLRMPCDWAQILGDAVEAADEIERLRAELELHHELERAVRNMGGFYPGLAIDMALKNLEATDG